MTSINRVLRLSTQVPVVPILLVAIAYILQSFNSLLNGEPLILDSWPHPAQVTVTHSPASGGSNGTHPPQPGHCSRGAGSGC